MINVVHGIARTSPGADSWRVLSPIVATLDQSASSRSRRIVTKITRCLEANPPRDHSQGGDTGFKSRWDHQGKRIVGALVSTLVKCRHRGSGNTKAQVKHSEQDWPPVSRPAFVPQTTSLRHEAASRIAFKSGAPSCYELTASLTTPLPLLGLGGSADGFEPPGGSTVNRTTVWGSSPQRQSIKRTWYYPDAIPGGSWRRVRVRSYVVAGDMNDPPSSQFLAPLVARRRSALSTGCRIRLRRPRPATVSWTHRFKPSGQPAE